MSNFNYPTIIVICGLLCSGCPDDYCSSNDDCIEGYACTQEGDCIEVEPLVIDKQSIPDALVGELYQEVFQATGGIEPYSWSIETDETWLAMHASTGVLSGTPESPAVGVTAKVSVTDNSKNGRSDSESFIFNIIYCNEFQSEPCSGNGDCSDSTGECTCSIGYSGNKCEECEDYYHDEDGQCLPNEECPTELPCSGHGQCDDSTGQALCTCEPEYEGNECEVCANGYHFVGDLCVENEYCQPDTCSGNGDCDDTTGEAVCTCHENWDGESCQECVWFPCWEQHKLTAPIPDQDDRFAVSVAVQGKYVVVGAYGDDSLYNNSGAVFVYHQADDGSWGNWVKLVPSDAEAGDKFGSSVDFNGDYLAIGAASKDSGTGDLGAIYVFLRTGENEWDQGTKIVSPQQGAGYVFGEVSLSGRYLLSAVGDSEDNATLYTFYRTGENSWSDGVMIEPPPEVIQMDAFGLSRDIDGDFLVVGAPGDASQFPSGGAVYVYHRTGGNNWGDVTKLVAPDPAESDLFGITVAISGDYAVVGAFQEDSQGTDAGAVYVFHRIGENEWDAGTKIVAPDGQPGDLFGWPVDIDEHIVVGAPGEDGQGEMSGAAYVFRRIGINEWDNGTKLTAYDGQQYQGFGRPSQIHGNRVVCGVAFEQLGYGAAYVY